MFLSLFFSFPSPLSKNKYNLFFKRTKKKKYLKQRIEYVMVEFPITYMNNTFVQ